MSLVVGIVVGEFIGDSQNLLKRAKFVNLGWPEDPSFKR